ncbi:Glycosyltransferase involved in cell wall bisynthesis [Desulfonatronum thiosulfatophilum]|uniref:Glycosyltransferase involved in cell wall bisynthesis n=1 Tax=Desulfonatronum thiosulfatophilum TaxID=617002 RepID=A0A1G6EC11_9BACT|nr:glycosyltransferase [Desulfonatronum thiosulfatophilum]SDB54928.1 Glycosyltransferase involved in cell wall bisynthesis [Desulfonatronum thiosulfatophilum]
MNILVASAFPADSLFANAVNTIKMADGFAKLGHDVTVVCRKAKCGHLTDKQLQERFHLSTRVTFIQSPGRWYMLPLNIHNAFARQVLHHARDIRPDFAFSRNYIAPVRLAAIGVPTVAESHAHVGNTSRPLLRMIQGLGELHQFKALVTIAPVLRDNFATLGAPKHKVHVLPDAVDLDLFTRPTDYSKPERNRPLVVYAGHLYDYKGIPSILDAAALSPEFDYRLVGGHDQDIARVADQVRARSLHNVSLAGRFPHSEVPEQLWASDVLLLPPSAHHPSAQWTSPVKLGEYLASGTPVVATRIQALEYWLRNGEVHFVPPEDPQGLVEGIRAVLRERDYAEHMRIKAYALAQRISYKERCRRILKVAEVPEIENMDI